MCWRSVWANSSRRWCWKPTARSWRVASVQRSANYVYLLHVSANGSRVAAWLRSLSDGFVLFDKVDPYAKVPGAVDVVDYGQTDRSRIHVELADVYAPKAYYIGINGEKFAGAPASPLPTFTWIEPAEGEPKSTPVTALHKELGAKMAPFAGYEMPLWYSTVKEEHAAVRTGAGIFDVTHMGVFDATGEGAAAFLHAVTTNDVFGLAVGELHYTYFLDTDGIPLDDLMIYRVADEHYLIVVNASNNDKNWAWLNAVKNGEVAIDAANPGSAGGGCGSLRPARPAR